MPRSPYTQPNPQADIPASFYNPTWVPEADNYRPRVSGVGFYPGVNNMERQAQQQTLWQLGTNAVGQAGTSLLGMTIEGLGGIYNLLENGVRGTLGTEDQTPWDNWMATVGRGIQEWGQETMPIDMTQQAMSAGASRFIDPTWVATMFPSLVSTMAMFVPGLGAARGATGLMSLAARSSRVPAAIRAAGLSNSARQTVGVLAATAASSHVENFMQAGQVFRESYERNLAQVDPMTGLPTMSDEEARAAAGRGAAHTYQLGWATAATNLVEYTLALRGIRYANAALNKRLADAMGDAPQTGSFARKIQDSARQNTQLIDDLAPVTRRSFARDLALQGTSEGAEEWYQEFLVKEGKRVASLAAGLEPETQGDLGQRLKDHLRDPAAFDAFLLGAIGGVIFGPVKERIANRVAAPQKVAELEALVQRAEGLRSLLAPMQEMAQLGLTDQYNQAQDMLVASIGIQAARHGKIDLEREMFGAVMNMSDQEIAQEFAPNLEGEQAAEAVADVRKRAKRGMDVLSDVEVGFQKYAGFNFGTGDSRFDQFLPQLQGYLVMGEFVSKAMTQEAARLQEQIAKMEADPLQSYPQDVIDAKKSRLEQVQEQLETTSTERQDLLNKPEARKTWLEKQFKKHKGNAEALEKLAKEKAEAERQAKKKKKAKKTEPAQPNADSNTDPATADEYDVNAENAEDLAAMEAEEAEADAAELGVDTNVDNANVAPALDDDTQTSVQDPSVDPPLGENDPEFTPVDQDDLDPGLDVTSDPNNLEGAEQLDPEDLEGVPVRQTRRLQRASTSRSDAQTDVEGDQDTEADSDALARVSATPGVRGELSDEAADLNAEAEHSDVVTAAEEGPDVEPSNPAEAVQNLAQKAKDHAQSQLIKAPLLFRYLFFAEGQQMGDMDNWFADSKTNLRELIDSGNLVVVARTFAQPYDGIDTSGDPSSHAVELALKIRRSNGRLDPVKYKGKEVTGYLPTDLVATSERAFIVSQVAAGKEVKLKVTGSTNGYLVTTHDHYKSEYGEVRSDPRQVLKQAGQQNAQFGIQIDTNMVVGPDGKTDVYPRPLSEGTRGVPFMVLTSPAGNPVPVALQTRNVTADEADLVVQAYAQLLEGAKNADEFISEDGTTNSISIGDFLNLIIFEGKKTQKTYGDAGSERILRVVGGKAMVGEMEFSSAQELMDARNQVIDHLVTNKLHNVKISGLEAEASLFNLSKNGMLQDEFTILGTTYQRGENDSYLDYLFSGNNAIVATDIPLVRNDGLPLTQPFVRPQLRLELVKDEEAPATPINVQTKNTDIVPDDVVAAQKAQLQALMERMKRMQEQDTEVRDLDQNNSIFREATQTVPDQQIDAEKEAGWIRNRLPAEMDPRLIEGLIRMANGGKAWGSFSEAGITLSREGAAGTGYHEAFHAVFRSYLSPSETAALMAEARGIWGDLTPLQLEEKLADAFMEYIQSDGRVLPTENKSFIEKFFSTIKAWISILLNKEQKATVEGVFRDIEKGRYKNAQPQRFRTLLPTAYRPAPEGFTQDQQRDIIDTIKYRAFEAAGLLEGEVNFDDLGKLRLYAAKSYFYGQVGALAEKAMELLGGSEVAILLEQSDRFAKVIENWEAFEAATLDDLRRYNITGTEQATQEETDNRDNNDLGRQIRSPYEFSGKEGATAAVRLLISMQPRVTEIDGNGNFVYDRSGFLGDPRMNNFGVLWNKIEDALTGVVPYYREDENGGRERVHPYDQMIEALDKAAKTDPNISALKARLFQLPQNIQTQFFNVFAKTDYDFATVEIEHNEKTGILIKVGDADVQSPFKEIIALWSETWGGDYESLKLGYLELFKEIARNNVLNVDVDTSIEATRLFLSTAGISVTREGLLSAMDAEGKRPQDAIAAIVSDLARVFDSTLKKNQTIEEKLKDESIISHLARHEAKSRGDGGENIVLGPDGKPYWTRSMFTTIFQTVKRIQKNDPVLMESLRGSTLGKASRWLKDPKLGTKIRARSLLKLLDRDAGGNSALQNGANVTDLRAPELYALQLSVMMRGVIEEGYGMHASLNMADKGNATFIQGMPVYSVVKNNTIKIRGGEVVGVNPQITNIFANYVLAELTRWAEAQATIDKGDPSLLVDNFHTGSKNALKLHLFPSLNPLALFERNPTLFDRIYDGDPSNATVRKSFVDDNNTLLSELRAEIEPLLIEELNMGIQEAESHLLIERTAAGHTQGKKFLDARLVKVYQSEMKLSDQDMDLLYEKHPRANDDAIDRLAHNIIGQQAITAIVGDFALNQLISNIEQAIIFHGDWAMYKSLEDLRKRTPAAVAHGQMLRTDIAEVREHFNVAVLQDEERPSAYADQLRKQFIEFFKSQGDTEVIAEKKAASRLKPFEGVNETDAQGYITLLRAREILAGLGRWTAAMEQAYNDGNQQNLFYDVQNAWETAFGYGELEPKKGVHFEKLPGEYPVYLKYSQAILFPQLTVGTELDKLRLWMERNEIDEAVYGSGVKVGSRDKRRVWNDSGEFVGSDNPTLLKLTNTHWRLQVDLPFHGLGSSLLASQQQKNILGNIELYEDYQLDGKTVKGYEIVESIHRSYAALSQAGLNGLLRELGATAEDLKLKDTQGLKALIVDDLRSKGVADVVIDSLPFGPDGQLTASLSGHPAAPQIQALLFSMVRNRVVKVKGPGGSLVQMSSKGFTKPGRYSDLTAEEREGMLLFRDTPAPPRMIMEDGKRKFYPGGVLLPSWFKDLVPDAHNLDGKGFKKFFGENPDLLKIVAYRIPNQAKASIDALEVVGFLPPAAGDTIVLYDEVPGKTGSDFDIDKMYVMVPAFRRKPEGGFELIPFLNEDNSTLDVRYQDYARREAGTGRVERTVLSDEAQKTANRSWAQVKRQIAIIRKEGKDAAWRMEQSLFTQVDKNTGTVTHQGLVDSWGEPRLYYELKEFARHLHKNKVNPEDRLSAYIDWLNDLLDDIGENHHLYRPVEQTVYALIETLGTYDHKKAEVETKFSKNKERMAEIRGRALADAPNHVKAAVEAARDLHIQQAVQDGKILSKEAFAELSLESQNDPRAVNNRLINLYHQMYADERVFLESMTPLDATSIQPEARALKALSAGYEGSLSDSAKVEAFLRGMEASSGLSEFSGRTQRLLKKVFSGGKSGVGLTANQLSDHNLAQLARLGMWIDLEVGHSEVVQLDENQTAVRADLARIYDVDGSRISDTLSAILNAFVDIAKDPYIFDLNLGPQTANIAFLLLRAGAGEKATFRFLKQPALESYVSLSDAYESALVAKQRDTDGSIMTPEGLVLRDLQGRLDELYKSLGAEAEQTLSDIEMTMLNVMDTKNLENGIRIGGKINRGEFVSTQDEMGYLVHQIAVLEKYGVLNEASKALANQTLASKADTEGAGRSVATALVQMARYQMAMTSPYLDNFEAKFAGTMLGQYHQGSMGIVMPEGRAGIFDDALMEMKPGFLAATKALLNAVGRLPNDEDSVRTVMRELVGYVISDSPLHPSRAEASTMLFGEENMAAQLQELKEGPLKNNLLIRHLRFILPTETEPARVYSSYRVREKEEMDSISEAWEELLRNDQTREFAEKLVRLSVLQSGMQKSLFTFHTLIPASYLRGSGYFEHVQKREAELTDLSMIGQKGIYQALLHLTDDSRFVPKLPKLSSLTNKIKMVPGPKGSVVGSFVLDEKKASRFVVGLNKFDEPMFYPVVRVKNEVYAWVGRNDDGAVFHRVEPLGTSVKGHRLSGYSLDGASPVGGKRLAGEAPFAATRPAVLLPVPNPELPVSQSARMLLDEGKRHQTAASTPRVMSGEPFEADSQTSRTLPTNELPAKIVESPRDAVFWRDAMKAIAEHFSEIGTPNTIEGADVEGGRQYISRDANGNINGSLYFNVDNDGVANEIAVLVRYDERRKGVATRLYEQATWNDGFDVEAASDSSFRTDDGNAFREGRRAKRAKADPTHTSKYELFPGVDANAEQREAIDRIEAFLNSKEKGDDVFVLTGRGGTGKTTIIKKAIQNYQDSVVLTSFTHKARRVLAAQFKDERHAPPDMTVSALIGAKMNEEGTFEVDEYSPSKTGDYSLIIVDETSMLSTDYYEQILKQKRMGAKVIFMGDNVQLAPVNSGLDQSVSFDATTREDRQAKLVERMRQGEESPIVAFTDYVAQNVEADDPVLRAIPLQARVDNFDAENNEGVLFVSDIEETLALIVEDIKRTFGDLNGTKVVVYNNHKNKTQPQSVYNLNRRIREQLWGEDAVNRFNEGEIVMAYDQYGPPKNPTLFNSESYAIVSINDQPRRLDLNWEQKGGLRMVLNTWIDTMTITLRNEDGETAVIPYPHPTSPNGQAKFDRLLAAAKEGVAVNKRKYPALKVLEEWMPNIEHGYAITSHKAQGSTYDNVYVFEDNILSGGRSPVREKNQSLYVAVSRPRKKLVLHSNKNQDVRQDLGRLNTLADIGPPSEMNTASSEQISQEEMNQFPEKMIRRLRRPPC